MLLSPGFEAPPLVDTRPNRRWFPTSDASVGTTATAARQDHRGDALERRGMRRRPRPQINEDKESGQDQDETIEEMDPLALAID